MASRSSACRSLLAALLILACSGSQLPLATTPSGASTLLVEPDTKLVALGDPDLHRGANDDARLAQIVALAVHHEDEELRSRALRMRLGRARLRYALAALNDTDGSGKAQRQWLEVRDDVARVAHETGDDDALFSALASSSIAELDPARKKWLLDAGRRAHFLSSDRYELLRSLASTDAERLELERDTTFYGERPEALPDEALARLGRDALTVLDRRLSAALSGEAERAWKLADIILEQDPHHLTAHVVAFLRVEVKGAVSKWDSEVVQDTLSAVGSSTGDQFALARLGHVAEGERPGSAALLGFALQAYRQGLPGECRTALRKLRPERSRDHLREAREILDALCERALGARREFETWWSNRGAQRSFFVVREVASSPGESPTDQDAVTRRALLEALRYGHSLFDRDGYLAIYLSDGLPPDERDRVRAHLIELGRDPELLDVCVADELPPEGCGRLLDAAEALEDPDESNVSLAEAIETLGEHAEHRINWQTLIANWPSASAPKLVAQLSRTSKPTSSTHVLIAAVMALLQAGELARAQAQLNATSASIDDAQRINLVLAVDAIGARGVAATEVLESFGYSSTLASLEPSEHSAAEEDAKKRILEAYPRTDPHSRYQRGWAFRWQGDLAAAHGEWLEVRKVLPDVERQLLDIMLASLEISLERFDAAERRVSALSEELRARPLALLLRARLASRAARDAEAEELYSLALLANPWSRAAVSGLRSARKEQGKADEERLLAFLKPASLTNSEASALLRALAPEAATSAPSAFGAELDADAVWLERPPPAVRDEARDRAARSWLTERIKKTASTADALALSRQAVSYAHGIDPRFPYERESWAWFHFIAGDVAGVRRLLSDSEDSESWYLLSLLVAARERGAIDDSLALVLWKQRESGPEGGALAAQALQKTGLDDASTLHYECRTLVNASLHAAALGPCAAAWHKGARHPDLAAAVSFLLLTIPEDTHSAGLTTALVFGEDTDTLGGAWLLNKATWQLGQGLTEEAAVTLARAWRLGMSIDLDEQQATALAPLGPLFIRYLVGRNAELGVAERFGILGMLAFTRAAGELASLYLDATLAADPTGSDGSSQIHAIFAEFTRLLAHDRKSNAMTHDQAKRLTGALVAGNAALLESLVDQHPQSALARLIELEQLAEKGRHDEALAIGAGLLRDFPDNAAVVADMVRAYMTAGKKEAARTLIVAAAPRRPDSVILRTLLESLATSAELPAVLRSPQAYDRAAEKLTLQDFAALEPAREVSTALDVEAFIPKRYSRTLHDPFQFGSEAAESLELVRVPRATRCEGSACLDPMLTELEQRHGAKVAWKRLVTLPAGPAAQAALSMGTRSVVMWVLPIERYAYVLAGGAASSSFEAQLPGFELAARSLRYLGNVLTPDRSEAVRSWLWPLPSDVLRFEARTLAHASARSGCPLASLLAKLQKNERGPLLADVFLTIPTAAGRQAILDCAGSSPELAASLGVSALLDDNPAIHRAGGRIVQASPSTALAQARAWLDLADTSGAAAKVGSGLPPYGLLEVALALPEQEKRELLRSLLASESRSDHLRGLAAAAFLPGLAPETTLQADIRGAAPAIAALATAAADAAMSAELLAAIRTRLDALDPHGDEQSLALARTLVKALVKRAERADEARLRGIKARVEGAAISSSHTAAIVSDVDTYLHSLGQIAPAAASTSVDTILSSWLRKSRRGSKRPALSALYERSLPEILPAGPWRYARIAQPGLFASMAASLSDRIDFGSPAGDFWGRRMLQSIALRQGGNLLTGLGGIDLRRPIECAASGSSGAFACSAYLGDLDRVTEVLAQRPFGAGSGLSIALQTLRGAAVAPILLLGLPLWTRGIIDQEAASETSGGASTMLSERVRTTERIEDNELARFVSIRVAEGDGLQIDDEYYLVVRDKLYVFSDRWLAEMLLGSSVSAEQSLAADASFLRVRSKFNDKGGGLHGSLTREGPRGGWETDGATVAFGSTGVSVEWDTASRGLARADVARVMARLPPGAISHYAGDIGDLLQLGRFMLAGSDARDELTLLLEELPPGLGALALGWYPQHGTRPGDAWLAVIPWNDQIAATFLDGPAPGDGAVASKNGVHLQHEGDLMLVSGSEALLSLRAGGAVLSTQNVLSGRLDAAPAAAALSPLLRTEHAEANGGQLVSTLLGSVRSADLRGSWGHGRTHSRLELGFNTVRYAPWGLSVVKQWLAVKNSLALPSSVSRDGDKPLSLLFEVDDAQSFARRAWSTPSPRVTLSVRDQKHLQVSIAPGAARGSNAPASLASEQRAAYLADASGLDVQSSRVQTLARSMTRGETGVGADELAARVVRWLATNVSYEVTPESVTAAEVITRRRGDCSEYSLLAVALLRAVGVPAKLERGFAISGNEAVAHAWVSYHDGSGWHEIDPTANRLRVTAHYIPVSAEEIVGLLALGRLEIIEDPSASR